MSDSVNQFGSVGGDQMPPSPAASEELQPLPAITLPEPEAESAPAEAAAAPEVIPILRGQLRRDPSKVVVSGRWGFNADAFAAGGVTSPFEYSLLEPAAPGATGEVPPWVPCSGVHRGSLACLVAASLRQTFRLRGPSEDTSCSARPTPPLRSPSLM